MAALVADPVGESEALAHIAQGLAGAASDLDASFDVLATGAVTLLAAAGALVARIEGDVFHVDAAAGSLVPMIGFRAPLAGSFAATALSHGHAVTLNDAANDPRVERHFLAAFEPRQLVVAPLMVEYEGRGFILALNSARDAFTVGDGRTLQRIADYGAIALRHAELILQVRVGAQQARALADTVRQINQSLEVEQVVARLARYAAELLNAHSARVDIIEDGRLVTAATFGRAPTEGLAGRDVASLSEGAAIRHRRSPSHPVSHPSADGPTSPASADGGSDGPTNAVAAPLALSGRAIGELTVFGDTRREFTDDDAALLISLANHAAVAIENSRLFREASNTARHAHALATAARALAFCATPDAVYAGISQIARAALGADGFSIVLADAAARHLEMVHSEGAGGDVRWTPDECWTPVSARVATTGLPCYASSIDAILADLPPIEVEAIRVGVVRSMAMLPLPGDGTLQGVFVLRFLSPRRFDERERRLFEDLATQISAAIRNAQLAAAERSGRERERALADTIHQTEKLAALGELVAGVAHELNNPLTGISMFAQLLLDESLDEDQRESVRTIKREADRAVGVIRDLLAFSRKSGPRMVAVDLNALITQTLRLRAYSLQTAGVQVQATLDPSLPAIAGDDRKLQQVLLNLIVNAEYAMHRQGTRELTVRTTWDGTVDDGRVVIDIRDTGTGMPPELVKHIFEPFFTTKPAGVGTGLGLSVSYGIIQAHGGTITVRSTPGTGSTFVISLPLRAQYLPAPATTTGRSRPDTPAAADAPPETELVTAPSPSPFVPDAD
jgi:signal transduction histidine kinase